MKEESRRQKGTVARCLRSSFILHPSSFRRVMGKISIASPQEAVPIDRGRMREVVRAVLEGEGITDAEISLAFVDNPTIHRLNRQFLGHDEPTDVLSFPLSEPNSRKLSGELVIGALVALAQAGARGHDV